ncbi:NAD-dependent succinate-semialdehyde dehydrogenase [Imbroritus primus]|uniref:NAD-dependent succinate-semialdehyde dehydrogenase n=1 Tax=Imbroritus primus TaxID=3058603 RepID=A0ACD3SMV8_9BURK|nr:NAD-dependent succinate-semialdehyde dehydrogenase [Burkholderiaceae bacterium PBA]
MTLSKHLQDPSLLKNRYLCDGQWRSALTESVFAVDDPATGATIASVPNADAADARAAIDAAHRALPAWRALTGKERARRMRAWYDLLCQHAGDLAAIIAGEEGKPLAEARGEVDYGLSFVEWFAEEAKRVNGDVLQSPAADKRLVVIKQPIGVCVSITPWNFPLAMITRKVAPALAAGCTIVVKPAEQTPLTALALGELAMRAGIPAGVLNILTADSANSIKVGEVLTTDPRVAHVSFTGSTEVGRILMRQSSSTVKKLALELGGHAPFIVFDDADLEAAVTGACMSKYRNAGQVCIAPNRFYVQAGIHDRFVAALAARSEAIRLGNAFEEGVTMGPLIDDQGLNKVRQHVEDACQRGAKVVTGGKAGEGRFYAPTVMTGVTDEMLMFREETFGPVIGIVRFETEEQALALANHAEYGLASYVYTRDLSRVWRIAEGLEFGMVGINAGAISNEVAPFGGVKQSGLGREGSKYGIEEYLELKYLCMGLS